jgi:hypothetical protein
LLVLLEREDRRPGAGAAVDQIRVGDADAGELGVEAGVLDGEAFGGDELVVVLGRQLFEVGVILLAERVG